MTTEPLTILITPRAKSVLETKAEKAGGGGDITGGLFFGCPVNDRQRDVERERRLSRSKATYVSTSSTSACPEPVACTELVEVKSSRNYPNGKVI